MTERPPTTYKLASDEKFTPVMLYLDSHIIWGSVVSKTSIRVSTWLRTNAAPDSLSVYNANVMLSNGAAIVKPSTFPELHVKATSVLAMHMIPPQQDPIDYDTTEPNRIMLPITAMISTFHFNGHLRISARSDLKQYMDIARETFTGLYDVEIVNPTISALRPIKVPYALVRQSVTMFALR